MCETQPIMLVFLTIFSVSRHWIVDSGRETKHHAGMWTNYGGANILSSPFAHPKTHPFFTIGFPMELCVADSSPAPGRTVSWVATSGFFNIYCQCQIVLSEGRQYITPFVDTGIGGKFPSFYWRSLGTWRWGGQAINFHLCLLARVWPFSHAWMLWPSLHKARLNTKDRTKWWSFPSEHCRNEADSPHHFRHSFHLSLIAAAPWIRLVLHVAL